jgi:hypothetical protein
LGGKVKRLSGNVLDPSKLLLEENLRALEEAFDGVFAFLAFHPSADAAMTKYLESGTLESDSGPNVLVLFIQSRDADTPTRLNSESFAGWIDLRSEQLPAQKLIRGLFEPGYVPPLPGLLVFENFTDQCEAVYFDLPSDASVEEVRSFDASFYIHSRHMRSACALTARGTPVRRFQQFRSARQYSWGL